MAGIKISELPEATALGDEDLLEIVQAGQNRKVKAGLFGGGLTLTTVSMAIAIGTVAGEALLRQDAGQALLVLRVAVAATAADRYDLELYDGTSADSLIYRAQQVTGSYLDSLVFYQARTNGRITAKVVNLRQDAAAFSATVTLIFAEVA